MKNNVSDLQELRIHELRDLARKMGVNAPTAKKKEELIEEILKIMDGDITPKFNESKKGRPVKNNTENFDVLSLILPNQDEKSDDDYCYSEYNNFDKKLEFMISCNPTSIDWLDDGSDMDEEKEYQGIVEISSKGYGLIHVNELTRSNDDLYVSKPIVKQVSLRNGEEVKAKGKRIKPDYPKIAYDIVKISKNGEVGFDELSPSALGDIIKVNSKYINSVQLGGRYFIKTNDDAYFASEEIADKLHKTLPNCIVENLYINAMLEKVSLKNDFKINTIPFYKQDEDLLIAVNMYFDKMKILAENGNNVVIVMSSLTHFAKTCNNIQLKSYNYSDVSNNTAFMLKRLISSAKNTKNGSLTLIITDNLKAPQNIKNLFEYEILPLFINEKEWLI